MALSVLACMSKYPIVIRNAECVNDIDDTFFETLRNIGIKVDIIDG